MSRIGKKPITIPQDVEISIQGNIFSVKGPKGTLTQEYEPTLITLKTTEDTLIVDRKNDSKPARARHGLYRSLAQNLILGVTNGFSKTLEIRGVGYRATLKDQLLEMNLGFSHPIKFKIPKGIEIKFDEKNANIFIVHGIDKQLVGQVCANIRKFKKPEPYKGKGIRYIDEHVRQKAGKSAKK